LPRRTLPRLATLLGGLANGHAKLHLRHVASYPVEADILSELAVGVFMIANGWMAEVKETVPLMRSPESCGEGIFFEAAGRGVDGGRTQRAWPIQEWLIIRPLSRAPLLVEAPAQQNCIALACVSPDEHSWLVHLRFLLIARERIRALSRIPPLTSLLSAMVRFAMGDRISRETR
jgi:hypothetical protein